MSSKVNRPMKEQTLMQQNWVRPEKFMREVENQWWEIREKKKKRKREEERKTDEYRESVEEEEEKEEERRGRRRRRRRRSVLVYHERDEHDHRFLNVTFQFPFCSFALWINREFAAPFAEGASSQSASAASSIYITFTYRRLKNNMVTIKKTFNMWSKDAYKWSCANDNSR